MIDHTLIYPLAVAIGIGLLIGIQREYAFIHRGSGKRRKGFTAGVRTYPLFALAGWLIAYFFQEFPSDLLATVLLFAVLALIIAAYLASARHGSVGITSEMAALVTVMIGLLCFWNELLLATVIGVTVMTLLSLKLEFQALTQHITQEDVIATIKFAVISAIILPILPTTPLGPPPFDVVNLQKVWLMAVFISGIGFLGYVLIKFVGTEHGIGLSGLLGGLVSSTAVTLAFVQRSREQADLSGPYAIAITVSWIVMFGRVMVAVAVINSSLLLYLWMPITAMALVGLAYGFYLRRQNRDTETYNVAVANPFELSTAIQFAILYGVILVVANAARVYFGDTGVYLSSILSGTVSLNAITLSMSELSLPGGELSSLIAARAIILAMVANTTVKSSVVFVRGAPALRKSLLPGGLLMVAVAMVGAFILI